MADEGGSSGRGLAPSRGAARYKRPLPDIAASGATTPTPKSPTRPTDARRTPTLKLSKSPLPNIVDAPTNENAAPAKVLSHEPSSKYRIVYRTKAERQVSSVDHVLSRYVLGRKLGDGNFAVVKQATLINTPHEYAMKIMDKVYVATTQRYFVVINVAVCEIFKVASIKLK